MATDSISSRGHHYPILKTQYVLGPTLKTPRRGGCYWKIVTGYKETTQVVPAGPPRLTSGDRTGESEQREKARSRGRAPGSLGVWLSCAGSNPPRSVTIPDRRRIGQPRNLLKRRDESDPASSRSDLREHASGHCVLSRFRLFQPDGLRVRFNEGRTFPDGEIDANALANVGAKELQLP
jgi:hypothetical protein